MRNKLITRSFARPSKKDKEKIEFNKRKEEANIPQEIDLDDLENDLEKIKAGFAESMEKLKIGRIMPEIFDGVEVNAYGDQMSIDQIAQILPRDATSILIKVYDPSIQDEVCQSLVSNKDLEFEFEMNEDAIIAQSEVKNTKEGRKLLVNQGKVMLEKVKAQVRKVRMSKLDELKKLKEFVSKDVIFNAEKEVGKIVDKYNSDIASIFKNKESQLMRG